MSQKATVFLTPLVQIESRIFHFPLQSSWPQHTWSEGLLPGGAGEQSLSKQKSTMQFAESHTDGTEDLGINGNYGLNRFIRIRKP